MTESSYPKGARDETLMHQKGEDMYTECKLAIGRSKIIKLVVHRMNC